MNGVPGFSCCPGMGARDNVPASSSLAKYTFVHPMKPNTRLSGTTIINVLAH